MLLLDYKFRITINQKIQKEKNNDISILFNKQQKIYYSQNYINEYKLLLEYVLYNKVYLEIIIGFCNLSKPCYSNLISNIKQLNNNIFIIKDCTQTNNNDQFIGNIKTAILNISDFFKKIINNKDLWDYINNKEKDVSFFSKIYINIHNKEDQEYIIQSTTHELQIGILNTNSDTKYNFHNLEQKFKNIIQYKEKDYYINKEFNKNN